MNEKPDESATIESRLGYLENALAIYEAVRMAPSVRDACRFIWDHLDENSMSLDRLFCAVRQEAGDIHFKAFIEAGSLQWHPDRSLHEQEPLAEALRQVDVLSSNDYVPAEGYCSPEIQDMQCWILTPLISTAKQIIGVLGACSNRTNAFSEVNLTLLQLGANEIMRILLTTAGINQAILRERERTVAEAGLGTLHDFKSQLGTIPVLVDVIEELLESREALPVVAEIRRHLGLIKKTAVGIRTDTEKKLAEIKQGVLRLQQEPIDVAKLLHSVSSMIQDQWLNVKWSWSFQSGVPLILARQRDLQEVFLNIIHNAIEAMEKSEKKVISLHVTPWTDRDERLWAKIEIEDTGCGIPKTEWDKIWSLTYSTKSHSGGFGLSRAKNVIEDYGGYIGVAHSQVNAGTTFEIRLPEMQSESPTPAATL